MSDQLKSARVTGSSLASDLPARIGELEAAISAITGIPLDLLISNPMSFLIAAGLHSIFLQDAGGNPTQIGQLLRNGNILQFHDSGAANKALPLSEFDATEITAINTLGPTSLYARTIEGGLLHTSGVIEGSVAVFVNSMLNGSVLHVQLYFGGVNLLDFQIVNQTGGTLAGFGSFFTFRINNRNDPAVQLYYANGEIPFLSNNINVGGVPGLVRNSVMNGLQVDTAVNQLFQVNAQWSVQSVSNSCTGIGFSLVRLR